MGSSVLVQLLTGVGCHALLQGIVPTQGSNLGLLHCRQILYHLSHQGSVAYLGSYKRPRLLLALCSLWSHDVLGIIRRKKLEDTKVKGEFQIMLYLLLEKQQFSQKPDGVESWLLRTCQERETFKNGPVRLAVR